MVSSSSNSQVRVQKAAESQRMQRTLFFLRDNMHTATQNKEYLPGRHFVCTVTIASKGKGRKRGERLKQGKEFAIKNKIDKGSLCWIKKLYTSKAAIGVCRGSEQVQEDKWLLKRRHYLQTPQSNLHSILFKAFHNPDILANENYWMDKFILLSLNLLNFITHF